MANRLVIQAMIIGVVLGMASGASAEGEMVTPIQQGEVDMGAAITLDEAAAAQAGIQATLGEMQAVASAVNGGATPRNQDRVTRSVTETKSLDGSITTIEPPQLEYEYDELEEVMEVTNIEIKEDGGIITEFSDGSGFVLYDDSVIVWDENGKVDVIRRR